MGQWYNITTGQTTTLPEGQVPTGGSDAGWVVGAPPASGSNISPITNPATGGIATGNPDTAAIAYGGTWQPSEPIPITTGSTTIGGTTYSPGDMQAVVEQNLWNQYHTGPYGERAPKDTDYVKAIWREWTGREATEPELRWWTKWYNEQELIHEFQAGTYGDIVPAKRVAMPATGYIPEGTPETTVAETTEDEEIKTDEETETTTPEVDLTKGEIDTSAIEKSDEMAQAEMRINNAFSNFIAGKLNPNQVRVTGASGDDFIKQAAMAGKGRAPTSEELAELRGKTTGDVLAKYGLTGRILGSGMGGDDMLQTTSKINWNPALSDKQKLDVIKLVQTKPRSQWNQNDVNNYNFATGSSEKVLMKEAGSGSGADVLPSPNIATTATDTEQSVIDLQKFKTEFEQQLKDAQDKITAASTELADFRQSYQLGKEKIGTQDIPLAFKAGQAASFAQQNAIREQNLISKLEIAQAAEGQVISRANLMLQIDDKIYQRKKDVIEQARLYRKDQQDALALVLDMFPNGIDKVTPEITNLINKMAKDTGIDSALIVQALETKRLDYDLEQLGELAKDQISPTAKANMIANLVATGMSVEGATKYVNDILSAVGGTSGSTLDFSTTGESRTDRNNNPTAMTTDVAATLGLIEGTDYTRGDPFTDAQGNTLYTAKLVGDPIATTIKGLDAAASSPDKQAFYTQAGTPRWTHTAMTDKAWLALTPEQKKTVIGVIYQRENGPGGSLFAENEATGRQIRLNGAGGTGTGATGSTAVDKIAAVPAEIKAKYSQQVLDAARMVTNGTMQIDDGSISKIAANVRNFMSEAGLTIPLSESQIKTIETSPEGKKLIALGDLKIKAEKYKSLVEIYGVEAFGKNAALLNSAYADLKIAWKEAANLGALTGPDVSLLEEALLPATGIRGIWNWVKSAGTGGILNSVQSSLDTIVKSAERYLTTLKTKNKQYENSDYFKAIEEQFKGGEPQTADEILQKHGVK